MPDRSTWFAGDDFGRPAGPAGGGSGGGGSGGGGSGGGGAPPVRSSVEIGPPPDLHPTGYGTPAG
jgi:hypothetical protein